MSGPGQGQGQGGLPPGMPSLPTEEQLRKLAGPVLTGWFLQSALAGILVTQVGVYFLRYGLSDNRFYLAAVVVLQALSTLGWSSNFYDCWRTVVLLPSNPLLATKPNSTQVLYVSASVVAAIISQSVFIHRAYVLSLRNRPVAFGLSALTLAGGAVGIVAIVTLKMAEEETAQRGGQPPARAGIRAAISIGILTLADLAITTTLTVFLWPKRSGFNARTDSVIQRVVLLAFTTSGITTILMLAMLILIALSITSPNATGTAGIAIAQLSPHVAGLVTVATLNLRRTLRGDFERSRTGASGGVHTPRQGSSLGAGGGGGGASKRSPPNQSSGGSSRGPYGPQETKPHFNYPEYQPRDDRDEDLAVPPNYGRDSTSTGEAAAASEQFHSPPEKEAHGLPRFSPPQQPHGLYHQPQPQPHQQQGWYPPPHPHQQQPPFQQQGRAPPRNDHPLWPQRDDRFSSPPAGPRPLGR